MPLSYLDGLPFALTERRHLVLTWGAPIEEPLQPLCERFLSETVRYWQRWVKHCNIPSAVSAAGDPLRARAQAPLLRGHGRDRRRDDDVDPRGARQRAHLGLPLLLAARCVLRAGGVPAARPLRGAREVRPIPAQHRGRNAGPGARRRSTASTGRSDLEETLLPDWPGFGGDGPVRVGNGAARQSQNDIFGEMVLALAPIFLDERFTAERSPATLELLERLARRAIAVAGTPDAGIWEYRTAMEAADVLEPDVLGGGRSHGDGRGAARAGDGAGVSRGAPSASATRSSRAPGGRSSAASSRRTTARDLDASLLQMATLRLLPPDDARIAQHRIDVIREDALAGRLALPLSARRRLRRAEGRVHHLHLLAGRGAGGDRARATRPRR